jgi:hypothetical protein
LLAREQAQPRVLRGKIMKRAALVVLAAGIGLLGACATSVRPYEVAGAETGQISRVEPATILSITPVKLSEWNNGIRLWKRKGQGSKARGSTIVLRLERNSEVISVTQGDDIGLVPGGQVWVQLGDRVRIIPR